MIQLVLAIAVLVQIGVGSALAWRFGGPADALLDPTTPARLATLAYLGFYGFGSIVLVVTGESGGAGPLLVGGGMLCFGLGVWLVGRRAGRTVPSMPAVAAIEGVDRWATVVMAVVGLAALALLVGQYGVPLLAGDPQASRAGFGGLVFDLFRWLTPPAALVAVGTALVTDSRRDRWIAVLAFVLVTGLEVLCASRALPLELALSAGLIAWWAGRRLPARLWAPLAAVVLILFVGIQLVRVGPQGGFSGVGDVAGFAVRRTVDRVLMIHPRTIDLVARTIPAEEPYLLGTTYVRRLAPLLGMEERPTLGYWLFDRLFPGEQGGFAAPGLLGEAWANGGPLLAALLMLALGAGAAFLGRRLAMLPAGPADQAFGATVTVAVARTYATSLNGFLLTVVVATLWWFVATGRARALVVRRGLVRDLAGER